MPVFVRRQLSTLQSRIFILSQHIGLIPGLEAAYVRGIARRRFGTVQLTDLAAGELAEIESILARRMSAVHSADRCREIAEDAAAHAARIAALLEHN